MTKKEEIAQILLKAKAVSLNAAEPFTYASGIISPIYCDNRVLLSYPAEREVIVKYFLELIEEKGLEFDVVAGTATAGIPWAAFLAQKLGKPMVYVKKKAKEYGKQKAIEGDFQSGQRALLVEDLVSTGKSSLAAVDSIRQAGGVVEDCLAIFTYEMQKAVDQFSEYKCNLHTLSQFSVLAEEAVKQSYIQEEEKEVVLSWNKDPENWAK